MNSDPAVDELSRRVLQLESAASDRARVEEALRQSEADLAEAQRVSKIGSWTFDVATGDVRWSKELFRIFGLTEQELIGNYASFLDCVHPDDRQRVQQVNRETRIVGNPFEFEYRIVTPSGGQKVIREVGYAKKDAAGRVVGLFGTAQDITERRQVENLLAKRSRQLAGLAAELTLAEQRVRRQLADNLHDRLQQSLVSARMLLHAVSSNPEQDNADRLDKLSRTLAEALETTRAMTLDLAPPVAMHRNLPDAIRWLECDMKRLYRLDISSRVDGELKAVSEAEGVLLYTAARELLLNVVKHSGTLQADLRLGRQSGALVLDVRDAGSGFDPVVLGDEANRGFGMFSIRERAELFGGTFVLETGKGRGVRAVLTLPSTAPPAGARQPEAVTSVPEEHLPASRERSVNGRRRVRVLFVDDHRIVRESLMSMLQGQMSIEVAGEAGDGRQAVERAGLLQPDIVLMDVSMPVMDGVEATRLIKQKWPAIKIIGLSMYETSQAGDKIIQAGADCYVSKSAPPEQLVEAIRKCVLL